MLDQLETPTIQEESLIEKKFPLFGKMNGLINEWRELSQRQSEKRTQVNEIIQQSSKSLRSYQLEETTLASLISDILDEQINQKLRSASDDQKDKERSFQYSELFGKTRVEINEWGEITSAEGEETNKLIALLSDLIDSPEKREILREFLDLPPYSPRSDYWRLENIARKIEERMKNFSQFAENDSFAFIDRIGIKQVLSMLIESLKGEQDLEKKEDLKRIISERVKILTFEEDIGALRVFLEFGITLSMARQQYTNDPFFNTNIASPLKVSPDFFFGFLIAHVKGGNQDPHLLKLSDEEKNILLESLPENRIIRSLLINIICLQKANLKRPYTREELKTLINNTLSILNKLF